MSPRSASAVAMQRLDRVLASRRGALAALAKLDREVGVAMLGAVDAGVSQREVMLACHEHDWGISAARVSQLVHLARSRRKVKGA